MFFKQRFANEIDETQEDGDGLGWGNSEEADDNVFGKDGEEEDEEFHFGALAGDAAPPKEDKGAEGAVDLDEEDNCVKYNLQPIVSLEEQTVASGHEDESEVGSFPFKTVYRWGEDVGGEQGWKSRATKSSINFYQNKTTGKTRMVCREQVTNKLRMNQVVQSSVTLKTRGDKGWSWISVDSCVASEDNSKGMSKWAVKFEEVERAQAFKETFEKAQRNNEATKV